MRADALGPLSPSLGPLSLNWGDEDLAEDLDLDNHCTPAKSRGSLWDSVLQKSLETGDVDRISAAIGLAEDGGASSEMLDKARGEFKRIAEVALREALHSSSECPPGSSRSEVVIASLMQALEQACEAGVCHEVVVKAKVQLRTFKDGCHAAVRPAVQNVPAPLCHTASSPSSVCSPEAIRLCVSKTQSPSRQSPLRGSEAAVGAPNAFAFMAHSPGKPRSPGRQASPGRVSPQVLGRSVSNDLEIGLPKPRRKQSRSPVGRLKSSAQAGVGERVRQL